MIVHVRGAGLKVHHAFESGGEVGKPICGRGRKPAETKETATPDTLA